VKKGLQSPSILLPKFTLRFHPPVSSQVLSPVVWVANQPRVASVVYLLCGCSIKGLLLTDPAAGGSDDWAFGAAGFSVSYTVELRDTGTFGFVLPANQIVPTGAENLAGGLVFRALIPPGIAKSDHPSTPCDVTNRSMIQI